MHRDEMLKIAYAQGVAAAADELGIEKTAFLGSLGRAAGWLGKQVLGKPGTWAAEGVGKFSPGTGKALSRFGSGLGSDIMKQGLGFGGLSSGLAGLVAPEGEGWEAAGKAFLPGFLSGAGWSVGGHVAKRGLTKGIRGVGGERGRDAMRAIKKQRRRKWFSNKKLREAQKKRVGAPIFSREGLRHPGEAAKAIGAKTLYSGVPFGGAWLGSSLFHSEPEMPAPAAAAIYQTGRHAARAAGRPLGLTAQPQRYAPNYGYYRQGYYR